MIYRAINIFLFAFIKMPRPPIKKELKVILEYEPAEDAEKRLQMAFGIILSGIINKKKNERKLLTRIQDDVK